MCIKPLNQINAIFDVIQKMNLSGNEQLVLLHLYNAFNRAHWTETIRLSDDNLRLLVNQYDSNGKPASIETIRRTKQKLKTKKLIDFTSGKGNQVSEYRLVKLYDDVPCEHPANTPSNTPDNTPVELLSNIILSNSPEDVKTVRPEIERNAHANILGKKAISEDIRALWEDNVRMLTGYEYGILSDLQQKFGQEALKKAISVTLDNKGAGAGVGYVRKVLENPFTKEGQGTRNDRRGVSSIQSEIGEKSGGTAKGDGSGGKLDYKWELPEDIDKYLD